MLRKENFTARHIEDLRLKSRRDPVLLERAVYAFGLLEALTRTGLPFIFKGGTCLMLLLDKPGRLSTDIDIIVAPGTNLDKYLLEAALIFPFAGMEEQKRIGKNKIEKRHFKFIYDSPVNGRPFYILLDAVFGENHYTGLWEREIKNELLDTAPEYPKVSVPAPDCLLADKLTAFAPHTTGIPLRIGKDMEVIKQLYDVMSLLPLCADREKIKSTYVLISKAEAAYRGLTESPEDCLWDSFRAALCIAARGKTEPEEYKLYVNGIRELRGHIYEDNFTPETAAVRAVKVMYFILCLLNDREFTPVTNTEAYTKRSITHPRLTPLKYLRKVAPEAYAYAVRADELLRGLQEIL